MNPRVGTLLRRAGSSDREGGNRSHRPSRQFGDPHTVILNRFAIARKRTPRMRRLRAGAAAHLLVALIETLD